MLARIGRALGVIGPALFWLGVIALAFDRGKAVQYFLEGLKGVTGQ